MPDSRITWRDIAADLRRGIADGQYPPGARLPSRSRLMSVYEVAPQTVVNAVNALRSEGLVVGLAGSGWYVRERPLLIRMYRTRLSREERQAGRGTTMTDAHAGGWIPRTDVTVRVEPASDEIATELELEPGTEVLVRDRRMYADDEPVKLATSYLPRELTRETVMEDEDTGPGGVYARLEEAGYTPLSFQERVRIGHASADEAAQLAVPVGAALFRITRTARTADRVVELNRITAAGERYELVYDELPS
jgi:GntR family transcriptional regulator